MGLAADNELKNSQCSKILDTLAAIATKEVKSAGKFTLPGLCMIKTRLKHARKAGVRMAFGKEFRVKAAPAKTIVKAYCVSALKKSVWSTPHCSWSSVLSWNLRGDAPMQ